MADDTNEDSWLYGTSNPDSTTNEETRGEVTGNPEKKTNVTGSNIEDDSDATTIRSGNSSQENAKNLETEEVASTVNQKNESMDATDGQEDTMAKDDPTGVDASEDELRKLDEHMNHAAALTRATGHDEEDYDMTSFEDPAQEMEEDEEAAVAVAEKTQLNSPDQFVADKPMEVTVCFSFFFFRNFSWKFSLLSN